MRLGIIGCGVIGSTHIQTAIAAPDIELTAVADLIPERREHAAELSGARAFASGNELIDSGAAEAVVLAVPAGDRIELPLRALGRGLHVLIEKPVAINAATLQRYLDAQGGLVAGCGSSRFQGLAATQAAAALVATGALGTLRTVHCRAIVPASAPPTAPPPNWRLNVERNAGGILCNWGCYDLDYLLSVTGWTLRPRTVLAQTWGVPPQYLSRVAPGSDAESHYTAFIRCDGGTVITMERGEYLASAGEAIWRIVGTQGTLRLHMTVAQGKVLYHDTADADAGMVTHVLWEGDEDGSTILQTPVLDFAAAIREGRPPRTDLRRAMTMQQITDAIYASAKSGKAIEL